MARFAQAIETAQVDVVPKILISGSGDGHGAQPATGKVMEALLAMLLSDKLEAQLAPQHAPRQAAAEALRAGLMENARR